MKRPLSNLRPFGPFAQSGQMFGEVSDEEIFVNVGSPEIEGFGASPENAETSTLDQAAVIEADINEEVFSGRDARVDVSDTVYMGFLSMRVNNSDITARELMSIKEIVADRLDIDGNIMATASCKKTPSGTFR
jgi:hypothetical protein